MQTFLKIFALIPAILIIVGLLLPNQIAIKRSIEVNAPAEVVHGLVNDLNQWPKWSPWLDLDPTIRTKIGDISKGVGAAQSWVGNSGGGQLKLTESSLDKGIKYDMNFDGDSTNYQAGFTYQTTGNNKLVVTWYMDGEMEPIVIGNYFAIFMDSLVGDSFTTGLQKLKSVAEAETVQ